MKIESTIDALVSFLKDNTGMMCVFGSRDWQPNEYPVIQITHERSGDSPERFDQNTAVFEIPLQVSVIMPKSEDGILTPIYTAMENVVKYLFQFQQTNHEFRITSGIVSISENDTVKLSIEYTLKVIVQ